jgi:thiosulfate/3-mercaptopyruvate sulfurtransferase
MKFESIEERNYKNQKILVSTDWLNDNLNNDNVVILDLDSNEIYQKGHIPGSLNVIDNYFKTSLEDRVHVQNQKQISKTFSDLGISSNTTVIGYDRSACLYGFRLAWVLNFYGHSNVKVLDGGFPKWEHENRNIQKETAEPIIRDKFIPENPNREIFSDKNVLIDILNSNSNYQILDVRSDDERNGINLRGGNRGGYIPNSLHKEWVNFNTNGNIPILKSAEEILKITKNLGLSQDLPTITYCQGGIRAAHVFWALKLSGFKNVMNYDASWREWGQDESCPIVDMI